MLIYNIPVAVLNRYPDKTITVRSDDTRAMVEAFSAVPRENLWSLQVLSMDCDADALLHLPDSVAMDLVVDHPSTEFSQLYQFAELPHKHPLRVTVRAAPGMTKAVKIAQALNYSVKLEVSQHEVPLVDELIALAEYYLRGSTVSQPVEPFHSLFLSFYSGNLTSLWSLQEEDPTFDRYVTDDGCVALSKRLVSLGIPESQLAGFLQQHVSACRRDEECGVCEFFSRCQGYFKVPEKSYRCDHVKRLFALLNEAAGEMRQDEARFAELYGLDNTGLDASRSQGSSTMDRPDQLKTTGCLNPLESTSDEQKVLSSFSMRRLDFRLPDFTRHSWANDEVKVVWEPRIRKVCACIQELEWRSILAGVRACALTAVTPNELESLGARLATHGLTVLPLEKMAVQDGYASCLRAPSEGEPFNYWSAIGRVSDVRILESAHLSNDQEAIGRLLGYPPCCTSFFKRVWVDEGFIDTTWPMAQNTAKKRGITPTHVEIPDVSKCNVLLRWLGPRIVFHLPCSFDCQPTIELAEKFIEIARAVGFHHEIGWLEEMLNWPVYWTALNGLAEITTPVGTISSVTDATAERYRLNYKGAEYAEGKRWTVSCLPDAAPERLYNVGSRGREEERRESLVPLSKESLMDSEWYYADNGFRSRQDMDLSHDPIVKLAATTLLQATGDVLDLGCGNGALLQKICGSNSTLIPWGADISRDKIAHARLLAPRFPDNFVVSNIFDDCAVWRNDREFQLVILMLGRLTEVGEEAAEQLLRRVREHARNLLVYAYEDYGSLEELARKTRLTLSERRSAENVAIARLEKL